MRKLISFVVMGLGFCTHQLFALNINDPAYKVETYLQYNAFDLGWARDFTFDSSGNMYVVHTADGYAANGSIQKITSDKTRSTLCNSLINPLQIVWGGGTAFGDNLYVTEKLRTSDWYKGQVTKIDLLGNKTAFCGGLNQPESLAIDRTGNYNGSLYIANTADDKILRVGPAGGIAATYSNYPYSINGSLLGLAFDTPGNYGGSMFAATSGTNAAYAGLFRIVNGIETRYANLEQARAVAFDTAAQEYFGGSMFVAGKNTSDALWTLYQVNGYFNTEKFATFDLMTDWCRPDIEFGPDGAMYIMEQQWGNDSQNVIISRVTPIPEPTTLVLLGLGLLFPMRNRRCRPGK